MAEHLEILRLRFRRRRRIRQAGREGRALDRHLPDAADLRRRRDADEVQQRRREIIGETGISFLEFRQSDGQSLVVTVPASEAAVLEYFQRLMPYGVVVPDDSS
jgi:hypothetical protein